MHRRGFSGKTASGLSENFYQLFINKGRPAIWLLLDEHCTRMLANGRFNLDRRNAGEKEFNLMPFVKLFKPVRRGNLAPQQKASTQPFDSV